MKKNSFLLFTTLLAFGFSAWGQIIISQYYEGSSNNKWIEITNVGDATTDLNDYYLGRWSNTDSPSGNAANYSQLTGLTIDAGEVLLFQHESAVLPDYASGTNSTGCYFNGDDPVAICDGSFNWDDRVDCIYSTGMWGAEKSFYRKSNVVTANTGISTLDGTGEWTEVTVATVDAATSDLTEYLGTHLYSADSNSDPVIINIGKNPVFPTQTETVAVFAEVIDSDGTIATVELHWGTASGALANTINMSVSSGDIYQTDTDIPAQPNNTIVYFEIYAEDNEGGATTSTEQSYVLPATTALPYMESFDVDLSNCYVFSVLGNTKTWNWNAAGVAQCNGYNSGDAEEDWLVLPAVNFDNYTTEVMTFDTWYNYGTGDDETDHYLKLYYSSDYQGTGDPGDASWTEIPFTHPADPQSWASSGSLDLSGLTGTVYLAFKYNYTDSYRWWGVDNISIYEGMIDVTFQVDMSQQTISGDGVFLVGDFSPYYPDWDLGDLPMEDPDLDQIYTITLTLPTNAFYMYKFVNGLDWGNAEEPPPPCTFPASSNRFVTTGYGDGILPLVCYDLCTDCTPDLYDVTFRVNMEEETVDDKVYLVGNFNAWTNEEMTNTTGSIWELTLQLPEATYQQYKFKNGVDGWETISDGGCTNGDGNREFWAPGTNTMLNLVCFGSCLDCGEAVLPYTENFDTSLGECTEVSVSGDTKYWLWLDGPDVAAMNGFDSGELEEDWLILPPFNFDNYTDEKMTFDSWYANGIDDDDNYLKLLYSTDYPGTGDPESYTWTELNFNRPYSGGHWEYSDLVDLSFISGSKVFIAFKYHYNPGSYMLWGIDNISVFEGELVDVTFQVNMAEQTVSADGVHIAGTFNGWNPSATQMTDDDGDDIYTTTLSVYVGVKYMFKYFNGDEWGTEESVPEECTAPSVPDRWEIIGDENYTIDAVCFSSCTNCSGFILPYTENFDASLGDCASVSVSGDTKFWEWYPGGGGVASMNGYDSGELEEDWLILPPFNFDSYTDEKMTFDTWNNGDVDDENNYLKLLYSTDYPGTGDPENYTWDELYFNKPYSGGHWEYSDLVDLSFISGTDVYIAFKYHYNPGSYVWWGLNNIAVFEGELVDVTFQVNMEEQTVSDDGVHLAGTFNGWDPSATQMTDDDSDNIYTSTLSLYKGVKYMFKYFNGNDWGTEETVPEECTAPSVPDRFEIIGDENYSIDVVCFGSCTDCGQNEITFRVDMQNETVSEEGVYLVGDFTNWGNAPLMMSQDGNIWSVTVPLPRTTTQNYKFVNGDPNGGSPNWEDFSGDCTTGDYNDRFIVVPSENTVLDLVCFNSCDACPSMPLMFSEIALPYDNSNGKFVELYNAGGSTIDFDAEVWYLCRQANGNPDGWGDFRLSGSIDPGSTLIIVPDEAGFNALYSPLTADLESSITNVGGGNDGFFLYAGGNHFDGTLIDAYGVLDENGNGTLWNYDGTKAVRLRWVNTPSPDWLFWEWNIPELAGSDQTTPGEHKSDVSWQGTTDDNWATKGDNWSGTYGYIPDASFDVTIPDVPVKPYITNQAACNNLTINTGSYLIESVAIFDIYGNLDVNSGATFYLFATQTQNSSVIVQGTATGFTRMSRYFEGYIEGSNGWHNISSPMNNMDIAGTSFAPGDNDDLYQWDEASNTWENYKQGHFTNFENGSGYLNAFEQSGYKHFEGTLNTDDIAISGLTKDHDGFHLLGNPFSSSIRWDDGNWNLNNIGAVAQIWDESNNSYAQIAQNETIPSTNGFFVEVGTAPGSLTIPKYARTHDMVENYKKDETKADLVETLDIKLNNDENGYYDLCRVGIKDDATYEWDIQYDAHKLEGGNGTSQIWTAMGDEKFVFNFLPYVEATYQLPLHFKAGVNGTHHINVEGIESFLINNDIYLEDLVEDKIINLNEQQSYSFSASTSDKANRFILHFFGVTSVSDGISVGNYQVFSFNNIVYIKHDLRPENEFQVDVFNTIGQMVYSTSMPAEVLNSFRLNEHAGIYIVQVRTAEGIRSQKVMIK